MKPFAVRTGFGNSEFDAEGRYVEADFGSVIVISVYFPSGSSSDDRQSAKFRFLHISANRPVPELLNDTGELFGILAA